MVGKKEKIGLLLVSASDIRLNPIRYTQGQKRNLTYDQGLICKYFPFFYAPKVKICFTFATASLSVGPR